MTEGTARDTLTAPFNDLDGVARLFTAYPDEIAAVIVEPVVGNMGVVAPRAGFLEGLRELCTRHGAVLVFDEVMTGFRLARGGAQERFGITPDLTTLGKIIGGGLPVGAYGGRARSDGARRPRRARVPGGDPVGQSAGDGGRPGDARGD